MPEGSRGDVVEVIVEAFVKFNSEITLLTVTQNNNATLFCAPIGHRQERGDYQESWQPARISDKDLFEAQDMAEKSNRSTVVQVFWCRIFLSR
jgi:phosphoribosylglycinamide formyltransferase 2